MANFKKHDTGWEYRLKYKEPFTGKFKEKSQRGFATKKEAQIAAADFEKKLAGGFEQADVKLVEYLMIWLEEYKKDTVRKNTFESHRNNVKTHISPYFQNLMLQDLRPVMYQAFLNHLIEQGYSRGTVEIVHSTMHNAMEKAVILGKIERNPCNGAVIKGEKKKAVIQFIDSGDISKFLQVSHQYGYIYWIFFKILIETGMRKGEAAALKWTDVDLNEGRITIDETLDFTAKDKAELFGDTKTFRSERTIRISKSLVNDLRFHQEWQNSNKQNLGDLYHTDLDLVLCREDGNFMPKSTLFNAFSRILKRAGLPPLPIHSLRHTNAVLLLEAGAEMKFVQEQLGHGSIQITSDVYAHISRKLEERSIEKYESYMQNILG